MAQKKPFFDASDNYLNGATIRIASVEVNSFKKSFYILASNNLIFFYLQTNRNRFPHGLNFYATRTEELTTEEVFVSKSSMRLKKFTILRRFIAHNLWFLTLHFVVIVFKRMAIEVPEDKAYGSMLPNGSWNGMIRMLLNKVFKV